MNISVLVGLKNNLEYSKKFYEQFRKIYPNEELCFVSYGSTDDTHTWLDTISKDDINLKYHYSNESKTLSDTYNKCAELATNDFIVFCHNDMVVLPMFLENIQKNLKETTVVTYVTIEPPIFDSHERPGKIIKNFGTDFDTLDYESLKSFANDICKKNNNMITKGASFFMAVNTDIYRTIGGMDNLYSPMFCEDDDLMHRLKLIGLDFIVSMDSLLYHFVSKTSRFSDEYVRKTNEIEWTSIINKLRKWGRVNLNNSNKYDIGIIIPNCNDELLSIIEPCATNLYVDIDASNYILKEQSNTKIDLSKKIKSIYDVIDNDVIIQIKDNNIDNKDYDFLVNLSNFIDSTNDKFIEYGKFIITIHSKNTYDHKLISNESDFYLRTRL